MKKGKMAKIHEYADVLDKRYDDEYGYYRLRYSPKLIEHILRRLHQTGTVFDQAIGTAAVFNFHETRHSEDFSPLLSCQSSRDE